MSEEGAIKALRDEATRLRRESVDWQRQSGCTTEGRIAAAHLSAASGRLLATARRLEQSAPSSWPPNNPDVGQVGLRVEVWPHDPGANGEDYHSGHLPAAEAAHVLRDLADRCESWADPECPWPDEHGDKA